MSESSNWLVSDTAFLFKRTDNNLEFYFKPDSLNIHQSPFIHFQSALIINQSDSLGSPDILTLFMNGKSKFIIDGNVFLYKNNKNGDGIDAQFLLYDEALLQLKQNAYTQFVNTANIPNFQIQLRNSSKMLIEKNLEQFNSSGEQNVELFNNAEMKITGNWIFKNDGGRKLNIELNNQSTLSLKKFSYHRTSGTNQVLFQLKEDAKAHFLDSLIIVNQAAGETVLSVSHNASMVVEKSVVIKQQGGDNVKLTLNSYRNNSNTSLFIGEDFNIEKKSLNGKGDKFITAISGGSVLYVGGDFNFEASGEDNNDNNSIITINNKAKVLIGKQFSLRMLDSVRTNKLTLNLQDSAQLKMNEGYFVSTNKGDFECNVSGRSILQSGSMFISQPSVSTKHEYHFADYAQQICGDGIDFRSASYSNQLRFDFKNNSSLSLRGQLIRNETPVKFGSLHFQESSKTVFLTPLSFQLDFSDSNGDDVWIFNHLELLGDSENTIYPLTQDLTIKQGDSLILRKGILEVADTVNLTVDEGGMMYSYNNKSYVDGYISKVGKEAFRFPVGGQGWLRPIKIGTSTQVNTFKTKYFPTDPQVVFNDSLDIGLNHLSNKEYWQLHKIAGTGSVAVTLTWKDSVSGIIGNQEDIRVCKWDGTKWLNYGNSQVFYEDETGYVQSLGELNQFSPFTIGSTSTDNLLPIELIHFEVVNQGSSNLLSWTTATETNSKWFIVERSRDMIQVSHIDTVYASGFSNQLLNYSTTDFNPEQGTMYYRLILFDFDGNLIFTQWKTATVSSNGVSYFVNPLYEGNPLSLHDSGIKEVVIYDLNGRVIFQTNNINQKLNSIQLSLPEMAKGIYLIRIKNDKGIGFQKLEVK